MRAVTLIRARAQPCVPLTTMMLTAASTVTVATSRSLMGPSAIWVPSGTKGISSPASRGMSYISNKVGKETFTQCTNLKRRLSLSLSLSFIQILDAFQADGTASNWFAHLPATSTHKDDVQSFIFKQLSHHSYQNDDCAGNLQSKPRFVQT